MLKISRQMADGANEIYLEDLDTGTKITVKVLQIDSKRINGQTGQYMSPSVSLGIDAPPNIKIIRSKP